MKKLKEVEIRADDVTLSDGTVIIQKRNRVSEELRVDDIASIGVEKRYSRVMTILVVVMAVITAVQADFFYLLLTSIMFVLLLLTKEERILVKLRDGRVLSICIQNREKLRRIAEEINRKLSTHL